MKVVFTNGCFDILHRGHAQYLEQAKKLGDILTVGINSDSSIQQLKGKGRPINNQYDRAFMLMSLRFVDHVYTFHETTVTSLILKVKPDIYVKGGDYTLDTLNKEEIDAVKSYGGEIKILPILNGYSTTNLINKIKTYEL